MSDDDDFERIPTGITELDRIIDGGFIKGSVIALVSPPDTQTEVLLEEISDHNPTVLFSTLRSEPAVTDSYEKHGVGVDDEFRVKFVGGDNSFNKINQGVDQIAGAVSTVIVDQMNPIEREYPYQKYAEKYREMVDSVTGTDTITILNCTQGEKPPTLRDLTLSLADVVVNISRGISGGDITIRLSVPKYRGGEALAETIKLEVSDSVAVDTSRDIA